MFVEESEVNYTIINGKKVPVLKCETEVVLRNKNTNYEYASDEEAEADIADPNSPTQREFVTRSVKIKVAAMPLGAAWHPSATRNRCRSQGVRSLSSPTSLTARTRCCPRPLRYPPLECPAPCP